MNTWSRTYRAMDGKGPEPAANRWAAELLMPDRLFRRDAADRPVTFATARELAATYRTSLIETARRLVSRSPLPAILLYNRPDSQYHRWHERGPGIPRGVLPQWVPGPATAAHALREGSREAPGPVMVPAEQWIMFARRHDWPVVCEDSVLIGEREVLTLLWWKDPAALRAAADLDAS